MDEHNRPRYLPFVNVNDIVRIGPIPHDIPDGIRRVYVHTKHNFYMHRVAIKRNTIQTVSEHIPTEGVWQGEKIKSCCLDV